ncbi:MAG: response regulator, partial [Spirochaetia bacterium]
TITCRIQKNLSVKIDPFAVDRIINNLLDNAVKYTDEDGKIRVNLHNFGNQVFLTVHNSGVLIPAEQQENIFKPFYQISHAKRNIQGIGMGLNIVKNILTEVDGTIEVKSAADAGTTFTVTFNRFGPSGSEKSISDIPLSTPLAVAGDIGLKPELYKKERKNILIVEDKPEMLAYLQDNLYDAYNVFLAENGRMAIERLEENAKPDIIVSDIMMDEMNGYEFYDTLMQNKKYSDIPFIFLTAMTADSDKIQGLKKGAVDYICKPFVIEELLQKIRSILRLQESLRKNQIARIGANITKILSEEAGGNNEIPAFSIICNDFKVNNNEKQIIKLLIRGLEYKEISRKLDITINIVKKRIHTIYKKFGVQNKIELVNCFKT